MQPLECSRCGNKVFVEKYSWQHTNVQWLSDAESACPDLRERTNSTGHRMATSCEPLRESIRQAVLAGEIDVPDD